MKKHFFLLIFSAFTMGSCTGIFHSGYDNPSICFADSTKFACVKVNVQLPDAARGTGAVIRSVVFPELVSYLEICSIADEFTGFDDWVGDPTDIPAMVKFYADQALGYADADASVDADRINSGAMGRYEFFFDVSKTAECRKFVVYAISGYVYTGGAHGNSVDGRSFVFRKCDGKQVRCVIDRTKCSELQEIITNGLKSYLAESGEELDSNILFTPDDEIPLPSREPSLSAEGVVFVYGEYEIMPYAYGMPTFTVPYEEILPYLSQEARELIP